MRRSRSPKDLTSSSTDPLNLNLGMLYRTPVLDGNVARSTDIEPGAVQITSNALHSECVANAQMLSSLYDSSELGTPFIGNLNVEEAHRLSTKHLSLGAYGCIWWYSHGPDISAAGALQLVSEDSGISHVHDIGPGNLSNLHPPRALNTPPEDYHLRKTLKAIQDFFNNLANKISGRCLEVHNLDKEPAFELQRMAANTHQAIASEQYDTHATFVELRRLGARAENVLPKLDRDSMHPRVLTVLLRLIVDGTSKINGTDKQKQDTGILRTVKGLFERVAKAELFGDHPVVLLSGMPERRDQTERLLHGQMELATTEFYEKIRQYDPVFVACEEIYSARVLASLGRTQEAEAQLKIVFQNMSSHNDSFTRADALRTWGFTKFNANSPQAAIISLTQALHDFQESGYGNSENVLYIHICFSWIYRQLNDLQKCEKSLWNAVNLWESTELLYNNQSGVNFVRSLDQVLYEQQEWYKRQYLRNRHPAYFEESRLLE